MRWIARLRHGRWTRSLGWALAIGAVCWAVMTVLSTLVAAGPWESALQDALLSARYQRSPEIPDRIILATFLGVIAFIGRVIALGSLAVLLARGLREAASAYRLRLRTAGVEPASGSR
jgi:hypothetical protein